MEVVFENVTVVAAGQKILDEVSAATIPAGSHVAIVGRSGAGKSTSWGCCSDGIARPRGESSLTVFRWTAISILCADTQRG